MIGKIRIIYNHKKRAVTRRQKSIMVLSILNFQVTSKYDSILDILIGVHYFIKIVDIGRPSPPRCQEKFFFKVESSNINSRLKRVKKLHRELPSVILLHDINKLIYASKYTKRGKKKLSFDLLLYFSNRPYFFFLICPPL